MRRIVFISFLLLLSCERREFTADATSIAALRNIETNNRSIRLTQSTAIEGVITANDRYGEFHNSIVIEDESAALKILCECDNSYQIYPFGTKVLLYCNGLYMRNSYGSIIIGAEPIDQYTLEYIPQRKLGQYLKKVDQAAQQPKAERKTIAELTPLDAHRLIEFNNIMIESPNGVTTYCTRDSLTGRTVTTTHTIVDNLENRAELVVNYSCSYADATIPTKPCTIQGIVDYYDKKYSITITNYLIEE